MTWHRFVSLFLSRVAVIVALMVVMILTVSTLSASEAVALRIFYSSNLYGEISSCG